MSFKSQFKAIFSSRCAKITGIVVLGVFVGLCAFFLHIMRAHTYIGDDSAACVNCHIMAPYYATWLHSSHSRDATCNDCHVPHNNFVSKYLFKGVDGMKHVAYFVTNSEDDAIFAETMSSKVIMKNCIRCHTQLTTEFIKDGRMTYMKTQAGEGKACWDCHRNVMHGNVSLSSTPSTLVPYPDSPVPQWLQMSMKNKK